MITRAGKFRFYKPVGLPTALTGLARSTTKLPYTSARGFGFSLEDARSTLLVGTYTTRSESISSIEAPDGGALTQTITKFDSVSFVISRHWELCALSGSANAVLKLEDALREAGATTLRITPVEVDPRRWLDALAREDERAIELVGVSVEELPVTHFSTLSFRLDGTSDVGSVLDRIVGKKSPRLTRARARMQVGSEVRYFECGRRATVRGVDLTEPLVGVFQSSLVTASSL